MCSTVEKSVICCVSILSTSFTKKNCFCAFCEGISIVIKNPKISKPWRMKIFTFYTLFPLSLLVLFIDYSSLFLYICGNTVFLRWNEVSNKVQTMVTGNLISLVAAFFTVASSWSKDRKRIFLYQAMQCFLLAIANIFFLSVSGTTTYALCALRNLLSLTTVLQIKSVSFSWSV